MRPSTKVTNAPAVCASRTKNSYFKTSYLPCRAEDPIMKPRTGLEWVTLAIIFTSIWTMYTISSAKIVGPSSLHIRSQPGDAAMVSINTWESLTPKPFFIATAAYHEGELKHIRDAEYKYGLSYIASRSFPSAVVVSETQSAWDTIEALPWEIKLYYTSTYTSKSAKESDSISALVMKIKNSKTSSIDENTMIIKVSGRYQVVRDDLLMTVRNHPEVDMIAKRCDVEWWCGPNEAYTFLFGLKWKYFEEFYTNVSMDILETANVEELIVDYADRKMLNIKWLPRLWVIGNINDRGNVALY